MTTPENSEPVAGIGERSQAGAGGEYPQPAGLMRVTGYPPPLAVPRLATAGDRIGAALLDGGIAVVTLGVGWFIWSLFTWQHGQSPGKSLLGYVVVDALTGEPFGWGRMFVRELLIRAILFSGAGALTCGVFSLVDAGTIFRQDVRCLHDQAAGSAVVVLRAG
ncbi:RDD family protein [Winogradskya humida]|uniref:RDD domain-containing protein n=1 Tax=Winogradskya humida TaxID=113566 RepID=A0ABQ4A0A7_9ACTN|nr:RDD family protein [Actinoplanes humidus]GIE23782.1 hypothetical protein Ahu01nite_068840 [Actinoplanes humidus]